MPQKRNNRKAPRRNDFLAPAESAFATCSQLAQHQALPSRRKPLRLPTYPTIERTSVKGFNSTATSGFADATIGDQKYFAIFRTPTNYLWESQKPTAPYSLTRFVSSAGVNMPVSVGESIELDNVFSPDLLYQASNYGASQFAASSSPLPLARDDDGRLWTYVPNCDGQQNVSFFRFKCGSAIGPLGKWNLTFAYTTDWTTKDAQRTNVQLACNGSDATIVEGYFPVQGVWMSICSLSCTENSSASTARSATTVTWGICDAGTQNFLLPGTTLANPITPFLMPKISAPAEFDEAPTLWSDTRANAVAVLFSNVTASLYKEGTAKACRVLANDFAAGRYSNDLESTFNNLYAGTRPELKYNGPLAKGLYAYTTADSSTSTFRDWNSGKSSGTNFSAIFRLGSFEYVSFIQFYDTQSTRSGTSATATILNITGDVHIEFRTTSTLWDVGVTRTSLEAWHRSQVALAAMPPFFENLTHMESIAGLAARLAGWALGPQGKAVISVGRVLGPPLARAVATRVKGMQQRWEARRTNKEKRPSQRGQGKGVSTNNTGKGKSR